MNDLELAQFLARVTATRNGFPVDALTMNHWREVLDPDSVVTLSDALLALVEFDKTDLTGFLKPAHIINNLADIQRQHYKTGCRILEAVYGIQNIGEKDRNATRELGRYCNDPIEQDRILAAHFDGLTGYTWAVDWLDEKPATPLTRIKQPESRQPVSLSITRQVSPNDAWMYR